MALPFDVPVHADRTVTPWDASTGCGVKDQPESRGRGERLEALEVAPLAGNGPELIRPVDRD